jgi:hypothetical protein
VNVRNPVERVGKNPVSFGENDSKSSISTVLATRSKADLLS